MNLRAKTYSAGRWTTGSAILRLLLQIVQIIILARLLLPDDFGLMAVVGALLALTVLFSDLGISRALVHFPLPSAEVLSTLYWINVGISFLLMALLILFAPLFSSIYGEPKLLSLLMVSSLIFPLSGLGQQFRALAEKDLRFDVLAINEVAATFLGFSSAVAVAWLGGGAYALVTGLLVTAFASSSLAWWRLSEGRRPRLHWRPSTSQPFLRFGGYLIGENFCSSLRMQADLFIGALLLGPAAMGLYALPRDLNLRIANSIVNPVITRVGFPVMARLQHDRDALKQVYLQTLRMSSSVNFPIYVALTIFAEEVVSLLFGPQWEDAVLFMQIFAVWGMIRSVGNPVGALLHGVGRVRLALGWNLVLLAVVPPVFWVGARAGGLEGLAWAMLLTQVAIFLPAWRYLVYPLCGVRLKDYVAAITTPLWISMAAGFLAHVLAFSIEPSLSRLILGFGTGAIAYIVLSVFGNRPWIFSMAELFNVRAFGRGPD